MINNLLTSEIRSFVANYGRLQGTEQIWQEPLIGFTTADDGLYLTLKKVIRSSHATPRELLATARSVVVYFLPFTKEIVKSNKDGEMASREWASAYVETNSLIIALNEHIAQFLSKKGFNSMLLPPTHNFDPKILLSDWSHKHVAYIAGLGDFGYHQQLITRKGSCGRLGSIVTEAPFAPVLQTSRTACLYKYDRSCRICEKRCPENALDESGFDRHGCYDLLLKNAELHKRYGFADVCGKCSSVVPCSFSNPVEKAIRKKIRKAVRIVDATESDAEKLLKLQTVAYQSEADRYRDPDLPPMKQTVAETEQEISEQTVLKMELDGKIIGSVRGYLEKNTCKIGKLVIHPDKQRYGLATLLMDAIEARFKNAKRYELFTGHLSEPALDLYLKRGYKQFMQKSLESHTLIFLEKTN